MFILMLSHNTSCKKIKNFLREFNLKCLFCNISFIGNKAIVIKHLAKILPDRNFISDLLHDVGNTSELSNQEEYETYLNN